MKKILKNNKIRVGLLFVCCALIVVLSIVAPKYILKSLGCRSDQADLRHMGQ